jgi:DNA-directed RNA polymerase subunit RPC12/RpoP
MKPMTYFGFKCPACGSTIDIGIGFSSVPPRCLSCGTAMIPNPEARPSTANAYCPRCRSMFGLINSDRCPTCGGPFSAAP